ncbi:MAG: hypothetical protein M1830_009093 [Pleopsidium flavum]|nr:MAG: hypothetical protein M1830_009093 [Pleopsidium flavum]
MTELSFAKSFLSTLNGRPIKVAPDYAADLKTFEAKGPYTLPKMPQAMRKRQKLAPGQERSVTVRLRSLRNPPLDMISSAQPLSTSVHDLKQTVSEKAGIPSERIKLLYKKKPCTDSKTLKELLADGDTDTEFSVMIMGGSSSPSATEATETPAPAVEESEVPAAQGPSGEALLGTDEFWEDLKGFLTQRLKDEKKSEQVFGVFKGAWSSHTQGP